MTSDHDRLAGEIPWPAGCIKPGSCSRNEACMYGRTKKSCRHHDRDISAEVHVERLRTRQAPAVPATSSEEHPPYGATVADEAYQVIGSIAGRCGVFDHPSVQKALDYFSAETHDGSILPFAMAVPATLADRGDVAELVERLRIGTRIYPLGHPYQLDYDGPRTDAIMHEAADAIAASAAEKAALAAQVEELTRERDEADRRAGEAARKRALLAESELKRDHWLMEAKRARGYGTNTSFDEVWAKTCAAANSAGEAKQERDALAAQVAALQDRVREAEAGFQKLANGFDALASDYDKMRDVSKQAVGALQYAAGCARDCLAAFLANPNPEPKS